MAPFNLFKKKDRDEQPPSAVSSVAGPDAGSISIEQAQGILQEMEAGELRSLSARLEPIKASAEQSLRAMGSLALEMEAEKIKLEGLEQRFKSLVENSRKTLVLTLKREAQTELELPKSVNEVRRFREKFEAMMKKFGDISGSHSKILNNFMKKSASKMRSEFEALDKLLAETKSATSDFDQKRAPLVKCGELLNTAAQKASTVRASELEVERIRKEIALTQQELEKLRKEKESITNSDEFRASELVAGKLAEARQKRDELNNRILELFSPASRAFTKYSYGVSKDTEARLGVMATAPWKVLDAGEMPEYAALLGEVRKSVSSGQLQLKDSDKTLHYVDQIISSLPELQEASVKLDGELGALLAQDRSAFQHAQQVDQKIAELQDRLSAANNGIELLNRQNQDRRADISRILAESSAMLASITGRQYSVAG